MTTSSETAPRRSWGLSADTTRGLIGKILLLAVVAAIAVALAIPLVAKQEWVWTRGADRGDGHHLHRLPAAPAHPDQVPAAGDDLPDRLPGDPGRRHARDVVHQLRRRAPRDQAGCDHGHPDRLGRAGRGLRPVRPDDRDDRAMPATGDIVFLLYDPTTKTVQKGDDDRPDAGHGRDRHGHRQGHGRTGPDHPEPRAGGQPLDGHPGPERPDTERARSRRRG